MRRLMTWLALVLILLPWRGHAQGGGQFLAISDIHFNPMADPGVVDRLTNVPPAHWAAILDAAKGTPFGRYGDDTTWKLLRATLDAAQAAVPHPDFLLLSGDFLAHRFRRKFDRTAHDHSDASYRLFVAATVRFLADQLMERFPGVKLLPTLGNNDADCGDYKLQPDGPFLHAVLPTAQAMLDGAAPGDLAASFTQDGNYDAPHPTVSGLRVISLNTVLFSRDYRNACGGGGSQAAARTMEWLRGRLEAARQAGHKVWLLYHIPPGVDVYTTKPRGACTGHVVPMWTRPAEDSFQALMREYAGTILASFAGHTHMDEFRLNAAGGAADGFVLVVPAVSPIFGENPAFQVLRYDPAGGLLDRGTHYLANLPDIPAGAAPRWEEEESFRAEWGLPQIDLSTLEAVYARITGDERARAAWLARFAVQHPMWKLPPGETPAGSPLGHALVCGAGHVSTEGFAACACGG